MKKTIVLSYVLLFTVVKLFAQSPLQNSDMRQVRINDLSDDEIVTYYQKLQQSGISSEQAYQVLLSRGLPQDELAKLQQRLQAFKNTQKLEGNPANSTPGRATVPDTSGMNGRGENRSRLLTAAEEVDTRVFGSEFFNSSSLSFDPNLRIATPVNYVVGPDDQLIIEVFGRNEQTYNLTVTPDGNINIPNVGPIFVSGMTIENASAKIKAKLGATIYSAIRSGGTNVQITLGNIKSIRINVIGQAKKPGTYTVSSLSTTFSALIQCGGPNKRGSYRYIELVRGNKVYDTIDLYKVLVNGIADDNVRLMDNDIILIPFYRERVIIDGQVKRPGIFELTPKDKLQNVLDYAGGFTDSAYRSSIKISRVTDREKQVADVDNELFNTYKLHGSDSVQVGKIINRVANRVIIEGAVMRPGTFQLIQDLTLKQLILKADGLKEDAFLNRGIITRLQDDLTLESVAFEVTSILNGTRPDIPLKREDRITISSISDLKNKTTVEIRGQVRFPGTYDFKDSTSIKDIIFQAGGFTEAGTGKRIEVARRVTNGNIDSGSTRIAEIENVDAEKGLKYTGNNFYLQPYDLIIIRDNPGYFTQKTIRIQGEVLYPGEYVIITNDEKLSDVIYRAGGFKFTADPAGASLKRLNRIDSQAVLRTQNISKLSATTKNNNFADSLTREATKPSDLIGINLQEIMTNRNITNNLIVEDGDEIFVPKKNQAVKVRGEALFPTQFAFEERLSLKDYIDKAGGFTSRAQKRKSFVLGANGNARRVKHFLFFKSYPAVQSGDEIFVPRKPDRAGLSTAEAIGVTSAGVGVLSVIIALLNNLKK
ncbi:MAG: SLBB domain-containing protein [Ferruginibacter sp.]